MRALLSIIIILSFFDAHAQVVNTNVPRRTDGRNIVQDRSLWMDRICIIPRFSTAPSLNGGVDTVGYICFNSGDSTLNVRGTNVWISYPSKTWVLSQIGVSSLSIYSTSSFLTGNRLLTGRNNLYGITFDSLAYLFQAVRSLTNDTNAQISIVPGQTEVGSYRITGSRSSTIKTSVLPGNYALSLANAGSPGIYLDSVNNTGLGTIVPTERLHVNGNAKLIHIIGGSGIPTVVVGSNVIGTVSVSGSDLAGVITLIVTSTSSLPTNAEFFQLNFNTAFSSAPIPIYSVANATAALLSGTYIKLTTTSSFQIATQGSLSLNAGTYIFNYQVIQ
ncbi:hypothetical protein SAMN05428988_1297 [Chitinophaga sp. YR573]|uniref:hypothetical protein n=1 Tax=Chitinophaga sp. YR573 TaxID=1881040 RepID=UPI0008D6A4AD|nr:hypothetical protein [Chitinophaga sp. YR573]SEW01763.1 hypothetical protein SAMN05428988_1297 [Chitinophaga sp. YR573]